MATSRESARKRFTPKPPNAERIQKAKRRPSPSPAARAVERASVNARFKRGTATPLKRVGKTPSKRAKAMKRPNFPGGFESYLKNRKKRAVGGGATATTRAAAAKRFKSS